MGKTPTRPVRSRPTRSYRLRWIGTSGHLVVVVLLGMTVFLIPIALTVFAEAFVLEEFEGPI